MSMSMFGGAAERPSALSAADMAASPLMVGPMEPGGIQHRSGEVLDPIEEVLERRLARLVGDALGAVRGGLVVAVASRPGDPPGELDRQIARRDVLRRHPPVPPDGSIQVRPAVSVNDAHVYYTPPEFVRSLGAESAVGRQVLTHCFKELPST